jgi:aspartyl-tRNA(Asn)/glutamyl-tRNA(Gln) amidotransferase subunit C
MADEITSEIFNHLVDLAALELTPEEGEYLRGQLNNQLRAIDELTAIPLPDDLPLAAHGVSYTMFNSQGLRPDVWQPYPDSIDIIGQVPEVDNGYVVVPDIPHTTLE